MDVDIDNLPDDISELKKIFSTVVKGLQIENKLLREQLALMNSRHYRRKSEKFSPEEEKQARLFDEIEAELEKGPELFSGDESDETVSVKSHARRKKGRGPLPADLPRRIILHDLTAEQKICGCGAEMTRINEEVSEKLDIIPAKMYVNRHVRPIYACKKCEGSGSEGEKAVKIAPPPDQIIPKSMAGPGLLAYLITCKFADALPFYRTAKILNRMGVEIPRSTMCNWAIQLCDPCEPLFDYLREELLSGPLVSIDETPVQVMNEPGRSNTTKSYMWVFRGGPPGKTVVLYIYRPTRSGKFLTEFLEGYKGVVLTDGYAGYNELGQSPGIEHAGCWAHVRRYFHELKEISPESEYALRVLKLIGILYRIEKNAKEQELAPEKVREMRGEKSGPIVDEFRGLLETAASAAPPKSKLGQAANYALGEWPKLIRFLKNGIIPLDNNLTENAIRPFVIGRKNWLFSGSPRGAHASALLYSLVENAKANGLEPYWYLRHLFEELPRISNPRFISRLAPHQVTTEGMNLTRELAENPVFV